MGLLTRNDGFVDSSNQDGAQLEAAGYLRCYNNDYRGIPCPFWISPEGQEKAKDTMQGYYTCPVCGHSYDLLSELPWHGADYEEGMRNQTHDQQAHNWNSGGGTRIGMTMGEQAEIGEQLVKSLGEISGYGPIVWWHEGGATSGSPLDGATKDWGIEVKTIGYDAIHHRFVPGRPHEKDAKNQHAVTLGKEGILGILVMLNYRSSKADIYVRAYPTENGVGAFRSINSQQLVAEIPFKNPYMDPASNSPQVETGHSPFAEEPIPF